MSEFRIDQIKSQDATRGPDVAGITTFTGTSGIVMPSGNTAYRGGRDRGIMVEEYSPAKSGNTYDYITISTTGNAVDFGDLTQTADSMGACASQLEDLCGGGQPSATQHRLYYYFIKEMHLILEICFWFIYQGMHCQIQ